MFLSQGVPFVRRVCGAVSVEAQASVVQVAFGSPITLYVLSRFIGTLSV